MSESPRERGPSTTGDQPAVPFTLPPDRHSHLNFPRIFEALIIAGVTALASSSITAARMEERLSHLSRDQERLRQDFTAEMQQLRRDMYKPRWEGQAMAVPRVTIGDHP
jgi:hypothetical protein